MDFDAFRVRVWVSFHFLLILDVSKSHKSNLLHCLVRFDASSSKYGVYKSKLPGYSFQIETRFIFNKNITWYTFSNINTSSIVLEIDIRYLNICKSYFRKLIPWIYRICVILRKFIVNNGKYHGVKSKGNEYLQWNVSVFCSSLIK